MTKKIETLEDVVDYKIENCVFHLMKNSMEGFVWNMEKEKIRKISKDIIDIASKEAKKRIDEWVNEMN